MTAEKETLRRVQDGLYHLQKGLTPFVEARMKAQHGARWLHYASRAVGSSPNAALDGYGLLKTMLDSWREAFDDAFGRADKHKARNFASMALEARNAISHLAIGLQDDEALRYLDAMHQLLKLVKAPEIEVAELRKLYEAQRASGVVAPAPAPVAPAPQPAVQARLDLAAEPASKPLRPWIEIALPHPDVLANRFKESEFAADLFSVDTGQATEDYATPENFFRITFLTEGLRRVLTSALQRLGRAGGDPVIGLQTAFGGGKTHTMLAVYHLTQAQDLRLLDGVSALADKAGVLAGWVRPKLAVFVGSSKGTDVSLVLKDGPRIHTLWGYIAWRLAGEPGLKLVAEAEAARTNPGSELMVEVLKLAGPSLILLDELVAYARQLDDDRFEAFLSFIQSLTEAAKMVPGALIIGSLPESIAEAGGPKGEAALLRLEKVFGRVQSPWLPAAGDETYEIIRRRLFQTLDTEGERAREETVKAFHDLYRKNAAEFPPEAKDPRYLDLLRLSYPIHPELFDSLSKDWASLERFQRTRGVLRFMANVVGVLWHQQVRDPLITPGRVPISHERVRASVLYPLNPAFGAVVDREVDGDGSLGSQIEAAKPTARISRDRAVTRAARAVFLCSAPLVGGPNAGIAKERLRLACAEPGNQLAVFVEAIEELSQRSAYLYEEAGRYWFSTQATLNRVADDRAKALAEHEVDAAIADILRADASSKGGFHRVFATPDDPSAIDEATAISLVILGPSAPHAGKGAAKSRATDTATDATLRCRASQRRFRNTLIFVAADEAQLATAREVVRKAMAWDGIVKDDRLTQQLTKAQIDDAKEKAKTSRDAGQKAVRSAWSHVLFPVKSDVPGKPFDLDHELISSRDRPAVPAAVFDKARADSLVKEKLGPDNLWNELKKIWPDDRAHLAVSEIAEWFASYVYLPKLKDAVVLQLALREGVAKLDPAFGYADDFDAAAGRYRNLIWARTPPDIFPAGALIVRAAEAQEQILRATAAQPAGATAASPSVTTAIGQPTSGGAAQPTPPAPAAPVKPRRFYGSVELDMNRPVKAFDAILNAVVMELQNTPGARVKLTLEIEAEAPAGFSDADVGVVRDNAKQLKFKAESTGFGD